MDLCQSLQGFLFLSMEIDINSTLVLVYSAYVMRGLFGCQRGATVIVGRSTRSSSLVPSKSAMYTFLMVWPLPFFESLQ